MRSHFAELVEKVGSRLVVWSCPLWHQSQLWCGISQPSAPPSTPQWFDVYVSVMSPAKPSRSFARRPDPSRSPGTSSPSRSPHKYSAPLRRPPRRTRAGSRVRGRCPESSWAPGRSCPTVLLKGRCDRHNLDWINLVASKCRQLFWNKSYALIRHEMSQRIWNCILNIFSVYGNQFTYIWGHHERS